MDGCCGGGGKGLGRKGDRAGKGGVGGAMKFGMGAAGGDGVKEAFVISGIGFVGGGEGKGAGGFVGRGGRLRSCCFEGVEGIKGGFGKGGGGF